MESSWIVPALEGLVVEAVEWLPSGSEAGLVRVRGRWAAESRREPGLPALGVRRGEELRTVESLPDARFGRDPLVWRGTYLVPAALMEPAPDTMWLSWESGVRAGLPVPGTSVEPAPAAPVVAAVPDAGGEVIDRAVLAERRARRAEAAERAASERASEALQAVEVLELRSAELERQLEELSSAPAPVVPIVDPGVPPAALEAAMTQVRELRAALDEQRQKLRRSELLRAADEVELATLRGQAARAGELEAALTEAESARAQAAEQVALAARRAAADAAAVREGLRAVEAERDALAARLDEREAELASVTVELGSLAERLAELESRHAVVLAELEGERRGHGEARARADAAGGELATLRAALTLAESARRAETVARAALDAELDRERAARAAAEAAAASALADLGAATARADSAESSAAATRSDLDAATARAATAESSAATARAEVAALTDRAAAAHADLEAATARAAAAESSADAARAELAAAQSDLTSMRTALEAARTEAATTRVTLETARSDRITAAGRAASAESAAAALQAELDAARAALAAADDRAAAAESSAEQQTGGLLARIAELERAADHDLAARAAEQAAAAAAVPKADAGAVTAGLDAAAAALRARTPEPVPPAESEPAELDPAVTAESEPAPDDSAPPPTAAEPAQDDSAPPAAAEPEPAASAPAIAARPRIITEPGQPSRGDLTGASKREYPWLRGAMVKLAHDDPRAAARLLIGLVPVQKALLPAPLEYDLTVREAGTYAISITSDGATASEIEAPRARSIAAFHAAADALTLAELLAGVDKRMGRWLGAVKVQGRKRGAETVRDILAGARLDLTAAARQGANLDPDLVFRLFAYAIHPAWTKGQRFTVAQELLDPQPLRWHVRVDDGAPVEVARRAPASPPDAVVTMTRAAFEHLLKNEPAPAGERPSIKGDRAAVATLKAWTERAQGRA